MEVFSSLKNKVMQISRDRKLNHFYLLFKSGMTVLDVGVASETGKSPPVQNHFLKTFRYAPKYYTGLAIEDLSGMNEMFPGKRFVQYTSGKFPFRDKEFDWVFSNAVIEHAGNSEEQLYFLNEMLRVANSVFFTTPNKYFPFEAHTNVLFLHWNDVMFYRWCSKNRRWANRNNLYLFSYRRLKELLDRCKASSYTIHRNLFLGLPMTFTVTCKG